MALDSGYWGNGAALDSGYWESGEDTNVITNADHIRSMTDEELAKWFDNGHCGSRSLAECQTYNGGCAACALDWLKQPYKEGT